MDLTFTFFITSIMLGTGLAMDAFSVSLANGLNKSCIQTKNACKIAGVFSFFQFFMPLLGWVLVTTVADWFTAFEKLIPFIAVVLLGFIGGKMLCEGIKNKDSYQCNPVLSFGGLIVQGIATSIDALSVGFTIASYNFLQSLLASFIIGLVTFVICLIGVYIGKRAGTKLAGKAGILGGVILILIGLEIFITSWI